VAQGYVMTPSEHRFEVLWTLLAQKAGAKCIVFMSTCNAVKFHERVLVQLGLAVVCLHVRAAW